MTISNDILVFFYIIWLIVLFFWIIRKGIEPLWKILPLLVFVFYIWKNQTVFEPIWKSLQNDYVAFLINFSVHIGQVIFYFIPYIWTVLLVIAFYMVEEAMAEKIMKIMLYCTIFVWIIWSVDLFFGDSIGPFLRRELPKFLP